MNTLSSNVPIAFSTSCAISAIGITSKGRGAKRRPNALLAMNPTRKSSQVFFKKIFFPTYRRTQPAVRSPIPMNKVARQAMKGFTNAKTKTTPNIPVVAPQNMPRSSLRIKPCNHGHFHSTLTKSNNNKAPKASTRKNKTIPFPYLDKAHQAPNAKKIHKKCNNFLVNSSFFGNEDFI